MKKNPRIQSRGPREQCAFLQSYFTKDNWKGLRYHSPIILNQKSMAPWASKCFLAPSSSIYSKIILERKLHYGKGNKHWVLTISIATLLYRTLRCQFLSFLFIPLTLPHHQWTCFEQHHQHMGSSKTSIYPSIKSEDTKIPNFIYFIGNSVVGW